MRCYVYVSDGKILSSGMSSGPFERRGQHSDVCLHISSQSLLTVHTRAQ